MKGTGKRYIWKPETGITDFDVDPTTLGVSEIPGIRAIWADLQDSLRGTRQLFDFTEKLNRKWAIETGIIEHIYDIDRGVTQTLIERGLREDILGHGSTDKPPGFVMQLLRDQEEALHGIFDFVKGNRDLSKSYIKELHAALLRSQDTTEGIDGLGRAVEFKVIKGAWKKLPNNPVREDSTFHYCPPEHVESEMDRLIDLHTSHVAKGVPGEVQAAWLHHRFAQIHPFQDGNGRVARAIASLVLFKDGLFPLVITRDDRGVYLDALEAADQGDLKPLIGQIVSLQRVQFREANQVSAAVIAEDDVGALMNDLARKAENIRAEKVAELEEVFRLSGLIEDDLFERLDELAPRIKERLGLLAPGARANVTRSDSETGHYFRSQIIRNAKHHVGYFANTSVYREWVALRMYWTRRSRLVFAFHGIGQPFNGSLICAPFLEFSDKDADDAPRISFVPLVDEGFEFFYNERQASLHSRFVSWREEVLKVALRELTQNL